MADLDSIGRPSLAFMAKQHKKDSRPSNNTDKASSMQPQVRLRVLAFEEMDVRKVSVAHT